MNYVALISHLLEYPISVFIQHSIIWQKKVDQGH